MTDYQHDYTIDNANGPNSRADINNALKALANNNAGSSEPAVMYSNMFWPDLTNNLLKMRNAANSAWIVLCELDQTNGLASFRAKKMMGFSLAPTDADIAVGNGLYGFTVPENMNGMNLVAVLSACTTKGSSGTTVIQIRRVRAGTAADMLSGEVNHGDAYTSTTYTINAANDDLATGDVIFIDVDAVRTGQRGNGITLTFR